MTLHHHADGHVSPDDGACVDGGHLNRDHDRGYVPMLATPDAIFKPHKRYQSRARARMPVHPLSPQILPIG